jgi:hypothetical protein
MVIFSIVTEDSDPVISELNNFIAPPFFKAEFEKN